MKRRENCLSGFLSGAEAVTEALAGLEAGTLKAVPQDERLATHCPMLRKEHGAIDLSGSAKSVHDLVRGVNPWPGAFTRWKDAVCKVFRADLADGSGKPGTVLYADGTRGLVVACGDGAVRLSELQLAGGRRMSDAELLRGRNIEIGTVLS